MGDFSQSKSEDGMRHSPRGHCMGLAELCSRNMLLLVVHHRYERFPFCGKNIFFSQSLALCYFVFVVISWGRDRELD